MKYKLEFDSGIDEIEYCNECPLFIEVQEQMYHDGVYDYYCKFEGYEEISEGTKRKEMIKLGKCPLKEMQ